MARFGVARAEELPGVMEGEVRRINLGEFLVVELTDEVAQGFPGDVYETEQEAHAAAARESGVAANPPDEVPAPGDQA